MSFLRTIVPIAAGLLLLGCQSVGPRILSPADLKHKKTLSFSSEIRTNGRIEIQVVSGNLDFELWDKNSTEIQLELLAIDPANLHRAEGELIETFESLDDFILQAPFAASADAHVRGKLPLRPMNLFTEKGNVTLKIPTGTHALVEILANGKVDCVACQKVFPGSGAELALGDPEKAVGVKLNTVDGRVSVKVIPSTTP